MRDTLAFTVQLAIQAGEILQRYFRSGDLETSLKEDHSLVTQADLESDRYITGALRKRFPEDHFLSEELSPDYSSQEDGDRNPVWVIDPLDGTTNFSLGLPIWGISIARLENGYPSLAVLNFPRLGEIYTACLGEGAQVNQETLRIDTDRYRKMSFFTCCSRTFRRYQVEIPYKTRILGCASYTFCAVARSMAALGFEATPKIWDIAAAWLIIKEAGGAIETLSEPAPFPLRNEIDYASQHFPMIAAGTPERLIWGKERIRPK